MKFNVKTTYRQTHSRKLPENRDFVVNAQKEDRPFGWSSFRFSMGLEPSTEGLTQNVTGSHGDHA